LLKLKRVEIQGFKSFFDRTEMRFNGAGIAAVVGPNGCGKSNLSDAISWVLGEQSAKSLRGARMEDVIFAGTRDKKPLGMAAVTITLMDPAHGKNGVTGASEVEVVAEHEGERNGHSNGHSNGHANGLSGHHSATGEVTITRRLFRSGESEYLINGRSARLRDIQDIFMGTGLGPESYAIIEQGRIGQILSNKPADRRSVIEEAAGVTKFKTRKRLAEAKLEGAKQNLARVFDILEEVGRQCNSLKRQAAKAKRYEELRSEMVTHLKVALSGRFRMLEREAAKLAIDLNLASQQFQTFSAQVAEKDQEQTRVLELSYKTEAELTESRRILSEHRVESERTRGKLESQARQIAGIEQRLTQGDAETQDLDQRLAQLQQELEVHTRNLLELEEETQTLRSRLAQKSEQRDQIQNALREREGLIESSRQQVLRLMGETSTLKNQLAQIEEYVAAIDRDKLRSEKESEAAQADLRRLETVKAALSERMSARQLELESIADQRKSAEEELSVQKSRFADSRRKLDEMKSDLSRRRARRDSLEEVISHRSYTTDSVKRLFTSIERGQADGFKPAGVLADFVEVVDSRFEKATEEFLHDELEYVVVKSWAEAGNGIDLMRSSVDGRATFLVEPDPEQTFINVAQAPEGEGVVAPLREMLRFTNGLTTASANLLPRMANCFLTDDRAHAQALAARYPDLFFLAPDGITYRGQTVSGGKKSASGPLALKRELREVKAAVESRQREVDQTTSLLEAIEEDIASLTEELERLRGAQQSQEKDALALDHEFRKLGEEYSRSNSRLSVARMELERLRKEAGRSAEQKERNLTLVAEKEELRATQEHALEQARAHFSELQEQAAEIAEEHSALRAGLAGFEERRRSEQSSRSRVEHQLREFGQRRQTLAETLERLGLERARLLSDNIELDARAAQLAAQIASSEEIVNRLAEEEAGLRARLAASDEALKLLRLETQAAQERRSQLELELVKKQAELKYLDETSRKELNAPLEELAAGAETVLDDDALAESEARYQEVKTRIDALGPVNPDALQEFQEAQQRYDFLNAQRQDLLDSIRDTEHAIHSIDAESRKRFAEAFEEINKHFKEMFATLFGGGAAEMRLTDAENINETGIDIVASPPGKKLQSVLLLSGGEKSLTAMALLMAIFRYQPSPFCILDEVDAPLDEPNIMRMTRLIKEMSGQTQFIVITHAKRTMEAAQSLYGVTMQEPGVSKLVSVRFEPALSN
jgi:chromosome segregation protein